MIPTTSTWAHPPTLGRVSERPTHPTHPRGPRHPPASTHPTHLAHTLEYEYFAVLLVIGWRQPFFYIPSANSLKLAGGCRESPFGRLVGLENG